MPVRRSKLRDDNTAFEMLECLTGEMFWVFLMEDNVTFNVEDIWVIRRERMEIEKLDTVEMRESFILF